jgi:uncharacterized phiE125 gp8 family phage protein
MQIKYSDIGAVEPLLIAEVKAYLKVDFTDEDSLVTNMITQVRELAEEFTGLSLIDKTIEYFEEDEDALWYWIKLPYPEHDAITEVVVDGTEVTDYLQTGLTQKLIKIASFTTTSVEDKGLKVTYTTTGYCANGVKLALLKGIAEDYEKRGNTFEGSLAELSDNFKGYLSQFKVY